MITIKTLTIPTTAIGTTVSVAHGLGVKPQIILASLSGRVSGVDAFGEQSYRKGFGAAIQPPNQSITQFCVGTHSEDNLSLTAAAASLRNDAIACVMNAAATDGVSMQTSGRLAFQTADATNATFVINEVFDAQYQLHLQFISGTDLTWLSLAAYSAPTAPSAVAYAISPAFKPDFLLFFGGHLSQNPPDTENDTGTFLGAVDKNGNQWTWAGGVNDQGGPGGGGRAKSYMRAGECIAILDTTANSLDCRASWVSMDTGGFTLNWTKVTTTTGRKFVALAVQGGQWAVGNYLSQTDLLTHQVVSGLAFQPEGGMIVSANKPASVVDTLDNNESLSLGFVQGITNEAQYIGQENLHSPNTRVTSGILFANSYLNLDVAGTRIGQSSVVSLQVDGWTIQHSVADPAQNFEGYIAYAHVTPPGLTTVTINVKPGGGGDYTNLAAALTGELAAHKNMLTQNIILKFLCFKGIDTTLFTVNGWNNSGGAGYMTGPNNYIQIEAADGHVGRIDASGNTYLLDINGNGSQLAALIRNEYVRFKQIQLRLTINDGSTSGSGFFVGSTGMIAPTRWEFVNCIEQHVLSNGSAAGCFEPPSAAFDVVGVEAYYINCIAIDAIGRDSVIFGFNASDVANQKIVRYNCTALNCNTGFHDRAIVIDKNNAALWCDNGWNTGVGAPNAASRNNFSTSGPTGINGGFYPGTQSSGTLDAKGTNASNGLPVYLEVNSAKPLPGDTSLIGQGVDLSADATYPFNFDVTGAVRTGAWTIGAFQVSTGAAVAQGIWWVWVGNVSSLHATVNLKFNLPTSTAQLRVATNPGLVGFTQYGNAQTNGNNIASFLVNTSPGTVYYYQALDNGTPVGPVASFQSFPLPNKPASFAFTCGGCSATGSNTKLYDKIKSLNPLLHVVYGDLHYWNIVTSDISLYRKAYDGVMTAPKRNALFQSVASDYVWDDHDYGANNSDSTSVAKTTAQIAYRENYPGYTLPGSFSTPLTAAQTIIFVKPVTRYEPKRAHVAYYNWANLSTVPVDLSSVLSVGDAYSVYDVRDLNNPILTGTYAGGTVNFPTTQKPDPVPFGGYAQSAQPQPTAPFFNAFLVVGPSSSFTPDFYVSPTGGTGAGTISDPWSLAYAASGAGGAITPGKIIALRGGDYALGTAVLSFTVSGAVGVGVDDQGQKVIFRAYPGEKPRLISHGNSAQLNDAVHFDCNYTWFWGIEWFDDGWATRDMTSVSKSGLVMRASLSNGVKLIHNIVHDFKDNIGAFDDLAVNTDKCEIYGCIVYNAGVTQGPAGHNFYIHHAGSATGIINVDSNIVFNPFGQNCQFFSNADFVGWFNALNNIMFAAGALNNAVTGNGQYKYITLVLGGVIHNAHDCTVVGNLFWNKNTGKALCKLGHDNTLVQSNIEVGSNYGVGGGIGAGEFATFAVNAPVVPQNSLNVHDNLWQTSGSDILSIVDTGTLAYRWLNNEWHHIASSGFDGTSWTTFKANTGLGVSDTQFDSDPGAPTTVQAGALYHSFVVGRCRFVLTDLRSERSPKGTADSPTKTMMGATQLSWFLQELTTAKAQGQFVFWFCTVPWIAPPGDSNNDDWGGFTYERRTISDYIEANGLGNSLAILCGDMHSAAIDDGTHDRYNTDGSANGLVVFLPFPENQTTQIYGGQYTQGPITHAGTRLMGFAGLVNVVDTGQALTITYQVINELGVQLTFQRTYPLLPTGGTPSVPGQLGSDMTQSSLMEIMDRQIERYRLPGM